MALRDAVGEASPALGCRCSPSACMISRTSASPSPGLHGARPPRRRHRDAGGGGAAAAAAGRRGPVLRRRAASGFTGSSGRRRAAGGAPRPIGPDLGSRQQRSRPHRHRDRGAERGRGARHAAREAGCCGRWSRWRPPTSERCGPPRPPLTPPQLSDVFTRSDRIVGRRIAGEYVLVPLVGRGTDADFIYTLNRVAAAIWEALDGKASGDGCRPPGGELTRSRRTRPPRDYLGLMETLESIEAVRRL